jgi:predicted DNA-binding transcriptional regulator AlpA
MPTATPPDVPPAPVLPAVLTAAECAAIFRVTRETIWDWVKAGTFPQPLRCSTRVYRWSRAAVLKALAQQRPQRVT